PLRDSLAGMLGVTKTKIRVVPTEVGGGFGGKIAAVTEPPAILLAQKSGRPVKITYKRDEDFLSTTPRRPAVFELKTGVMKDGTLVARQARAYYGNGAYHIATGYNFGEGLAGALDVPHKLSHADFYCLYPFHKQPPLRGVPAPWGSHILLS